MCVCVEGVEVMVCSLSCNRYVSIYKGKVLMVVRFLPDQEYPFAHYLTHSPDV